jgi:hypothetical protein
MTKSSTSSADNTPDYRKIWPSKFRCKVKTIRWLDSSLEYALQIRTLWQRRVNEGLVESEEYFER